MGQHEKARDEEIHVAGCVFAVLFWLTVLGGLVYWARQPPTPPSREPEYMVSITGVDGLNLEATSGCSVPTTLSPVLNLTVRIDGGYNSWERRPCVQRLSTAVVSYGDAFLGKCSVPPFCAEDNEVQERMVTAWGDDVVLPRFLRERLSAELKRGEASLDVQVNMPAKACSTCDDKVLVCSKVKIGGNSPSTCSVEYVRPMPAAGSISTS